jgi:prepilin-type N-terminal cleavage/methylation domain-containing protein
MTMTKGFTLIELLVVAALVVFLAGGSAVALRRSHSTALWTAEQLVRSLITQAQSVARATQLATRLVVHAANSAGAGANGLPRALAIHQVKPDGSWVRTGPIAYLPRGVGIVPPAEVPIGSIPAEFERSTLGLLPGHDEPGNLGGATPGLYLQFEADGGLADALGEEAGIVLTAFSGGAMNPRFDSSRPLHIVRVGSRGAVTLGR